jgi:hypothetical protein
MSVVIRFAPLVMAWVVSAGCYDTTVVTGSDAPDAVRSPVCASADCTTFRAIALPQVNSLINSATFRAVSALKDRELGGRIAAGMTTVQSDFAAGRLTDAKLGLISVLFRIDGAISDPARRPDLPELAAIRLDLEPLIIRFGMR